MLTLPLLQLKFLDESHFVATDLRRTKRVGLRGRELCVIDSLPRGSSYSMTLLTSLEHDAAPVLYNLSPQMTNCWSFFDFVLNAIELRYIGFGDLLVVDNASVHVAINMLPLLTEALHEIGARLVRLPTYSPEFNPCEQVFSWVKRNLRMYYQPDETVPARVAESLRLLPFSNVAQYYKSCTNVAFQRLDRDY